MDWSQRLNTALEYLEATWNSEPDLEWAAALANCSLFHFLRMFEVVFGLTPSEYSRRRRLSRAAVDLAAGKEKIIDVSLRYGYETPEAFTKAFKKLFGLTPSEARSPEVPLEIWPPLQIVVVLKGANILKYRIVEKSAFEVVGWTERTVTSGGENFQTIPQFWENCSKDGRVEALIPYHGPLGLLGVCAEVDPKGDSFTYLIGIEKVPGNNYPQGTKTISIPASTYVVFTSIGAMPYAIQDIWKRAYSEWFPTSFYEHNGTPDFEVYPMFPDGDKRGDSSSPECETEVWIPIKKKLS